MKITKTDHNEIFTTLRSGKITVDMNKKDRTINWSSYGSQDLETTKEFIDILTRAVFELAKYNL